MNSVPLSEAVNSDWWVLVAFAAIPVVFGLLEWNRRSVESYHKGDLPPWPPLGELKRDNGFDSDSTEGQDG